VLKDEPRKRSARKATAARSPENNNRHLTGTPSARAPLGYIASYLLDLWGGGFEGSVLFVAGSETRAERLAAILAAFEPTSRPMVLPRQEPSPADQPPLPETAGRRASVLRRLAELPRCLILSTPDALLELVPPPETWKNRTKTVRLGAKLSPNELETFLDHSGYQWVARVDSACEASLQGNTVDIFPAGGLTPVRIEMDNAHVVRLERFDLDTQRAVDAIDELVLDVASEAVLHQRGNPQKAPVPIFDYFNDLQIICDPGFEKAARSVVERSEEAQEAQLVLRSVAGGAIGLLRASPNLMALQNWLNEIEQRGPKVLSDEPAQNSVPFFAAESRARSAARKFVAQQSAIKHRIVLAGSSEEEIKRMARWLAVPFSDIEQARSWPAVFDIAAGRLAKLTVALEGGFILPNEGVSVIAAVDMFGSRAVAAQTAFLKRSDSEVGFDASVRFDDIVVHLERGVATLSALEVGAADHPEAEMVRLSFADGSALMGPHELALIWRYGSEKSKVKLDRLDPASWAARRAELEHGLERTAVEIDKLVRRRRARDTEKLIPPQGEYERFASRFPHSLTADQVAATEDILADLASGHPMDRLVCGDVGYGKTEVALRAAAAVALAGRQVAMIAPTTVLARQHFETVRRRFMAFGIEVAELSRSKTGSEARKIKQGLSDGAIRIVVGTHAILAKDIRFSELGLIIVDEEQHFGTREKAKIRGLADTAHVLTLTATPIPRTLQMALSGLRDLSVIATPPVRRRPVRASQIEFGPEAVRTALLYEKRRGGQSFVVCPRIEDLEPMGDRLRAIVPDLVITTVHGKLPASDLEQAMASFAAGGSDVLLATNIIESGLDLPRVNTIMIWRPDRFGLAQLHQLRGRVGRSSRQGFAYLVTDPDAALGKVSERRLSALQDMQSLGAGFTISGHDLDLRGAGDLLGEQQAGHISLVGPELYRHLVDQATSRARGKKVQRDYVPHLNIELHGMLPRSFISEDEARLDLYDRIAKARSIDVLEDIEDEIIDRFGPLPDAAKRLLELADLRQRCVAAGVARVDAGPKAISVHFHDQAPLPDVNRRGGPLPKRQGRKLVFQMPSDSTDRIGLIMDLLLDIAPAPGP
jgi:transcription-repair coupling factor (superfamily II helicase)